MKVKERKREERKKKEKDKKGNRLGEREKLVGEDIGVP